MRGEIAENCPNYSQVGLRTWTTGIPEHGGSFREDEAQSNGEPTIPPFAFNVQDNVSSQLASEAFESFPLQHVSSSSTSQVYVPQVVTNSGSPASLVRPKPYSIKMVRQGWRSPPTSVFRSSKVKRKKNGLTVHPQGRQQVFLIWPKNFFRNIEALPTPQQQYWGGEFCTNKASPG